MYGTPKDPLEKYNISTLGFKSNYLNKTKIDDI